jgi:hypothetical protein
MTNPPRLWVPNDTPIAREALAAMAVRPVGDQVAAHFAEYAAAEELNRLRDALRSIMGMLDDPTGMEHVRDMRGATVIARAALRGKP